MAEKKFSQLTAKAATIADTDLVAISESAGGGTYVSKSVTGANIKALVTDANLVTSDITTNNVSTAKHGFVPKAPNDATQFLDGTGAFDTVKDTDLSLSDNTTNDVSISQHGFVPKAPNNTTTFLRGDGTWATPASGGLTKFTEAESTSAPNATVPVNSLTATGAATNIDAAIVPKGTGAFMLAVPDNTVTGGDKRGVGAVDLQLSRSASGRVASGNYSAILGGQNSVASNTGALAFYGFAQGQNSTCINTAIGIDGSATNQYGIAMGGRATSTGLGGLAMGLGWPWSAATASGDQSIAISSGGIASAARATVLGGDGSTANGISSYAFGSNTHVFGITSRQVKGHAYNVGTGVTSGSTQKSEFYLSNRTTGNTATTVTVSGTAASTTNQVILSNNSAYGFTGTIIGKQSGSTNAAMWKVEGLIARGANAASTVLTTSTVTLVSNAPAWGTPTLTADTTNGGLQVQVVGAAATNIQWTAVIETTEVIYA